MNALRRLLTAVVIVLLAAGIPGVVGAAPSGTPIRIGGTLALTGPLATTGQVHKIVGEIYVEQLNAKNGLLGRPVEWIVKDDQSKPELARTLYEQLITVDKAGALSGGQQQMLAIVRALMACPRLLLLDEPSLGLAPAIVLDVFSIIRRIHGEGVTILLSEQNVALALEMATRAYVLEEGRIVAEGEPATLFRDPRLRRAYLGDAG